MNIKDVKIIAEHTHNDDKRRLAEFAIACFERAEKADGVLITPILKDHISMKVCWHGIADRFCAPGRKDAQDIRTAKFALGQMKDHLEQLAEAYYAGEMPSEMLDGFFQLYCAGEEHREAAKNKEIAPCAT